MSLNPKRSRQKGQSSNSFKAYAAQNCGKLTARLPFLPKQQIRAKLLDSWRRSQVGRSKLKNSPSSQETDSADHSDNLDSEEMSDFKVKQGCVLKRDNPDSEETSDSKGKQAGSEVQDTGVVSGLFKSRLTETSPKGSEASVTRLLPSKESEGSSNFRAMFSDQDEIFL